MDESQIISLPLITLPCVQQPSCSCLGSAELLVSGATYTGERLPCCDLRGVIIHQHRTVTYFSHSVSWPTVSSQPGKILAASTGEMQHRPMGFLAAWNAFRTSSTSLDTVQFLPWVAQVLRFLATPKPPEKKETEMLVLQGRIKNLSKKDLAFPFWVTPLCVPASASLPQRAVGWWGRGQLVSAGCKHRWKMAILPTPSYLLASALPSFCPAHGSHAIQGSRIFKLLPSPQACRPRVLSFLPGIIRASSPFTSSLARSLMLPLAILALSTNTLRFSWVGCPLTWSTTCIWSTLGA